MHIWLTRRFQTRFVTMILKNRPAVCLAALCLLLCAVPAPAEDPGRGRSCDPMLTALFAPRQPRLGRYEACIDPRPIADVVPSGWTVRALDPLDALGIAGAYDRAAVARLYGAARASVARGWIYSRQSSVDSRQSSVDSRQSSVDSRQSGIDSRPGRFESLTLISPYPNAALTRLEPGTLVIRWICDYGNAQCKMPNAK